MRKNVKQLLSIILVAIVCSSLVINKPMVTNAASELEEINASKTKAEAESITLGKSYKVNLGKANERSYIKFKVKEDSYLKFSVKIPTTGKLEYGAVLTDRKSGNIYVSCIGYRGDGSELGELNTKTYYFIPITVPKGTYYLTLVPGDGIDGPYFQGDVTAPKIATIKISAVKAEDE